MPATSTYVYELLTRNWWAVALRGVVGILFGLAAFFLPEITLLTLIVLLAAYLLADGVFAIIAGVRAARRGERWWPFALEGVANIAAAIVAIVWPQLTALALMYLVAIWAIFTGVIAVIGGFQLRFGAPKWLIVVGGILSILLGILMITHPVVGVLTIVWWTGAYALTFGILFLAFGIWLRQQRPSAAR